MSTVIKTVTKICPQSWSETGSKQRSPCVDIISLMTSNNDADDQFHMKGQRLSDSVSIVIKMLLFYVLRLFSVFNHFRVFGLRCSCSFIVTGVGICVLCIFVASLFP